MAATQRVLKKLQRKFNYLLLPAHPHNQGSDPCVQERFHFIHSTTCSGTSCKTAYNHITAWKRLSCAYLSKSIAHGVQATGTHEVGESNKLDYVSSHSAACEGSLEAWTTWLTFVHVIPGACRQHRGYASWRNQRFQLR